MKSVLFILILLALLLLSSCVKEVKEECEMQAGFTCEDYDAEFEETEVRVEMRIQNNLGADITSGTIEMRGKDEYEGCSDMATFSEVPDQDYLAGTLDFYCDRADSDVLKADILVSYIRSGLTVSNTAKGSITAKID